METSTVPSGTFSFSVHDRGTQRKRLEKHCFR